MQFKLVRNITAASL